MKQAEVLTAEILGAERYVPNAQDDTGHQTPDRLEDDNEPTGLEVVGQVGIDPDCDDGNG